MWPPEQRRHPVFGLPSSPLSSFSHTFPSHVHDFPANCVSSHINLPVTFMACLSRFPHGAHPGVLHTFLTWVIRVSAPRSRCSCASADCCPISHLRGSAFKALFTCLVHGFSIPTAAQASSSSNPLSAPLMSSRTRYCTAMPDDIRNVIWVFFSRA